MPYQAPMGPEFNRRQGIQAPLGLDCLAVLVLHAALRAARNIAGVVSSKPIRGGQEWVSAIQAARRLALKWVPYSKKPMAVGRWLDSVLQIAGL